MKTNTIAVFLISILFASASANAQNIKNWAVGLKVGEPTGLNFRKYGNRNALDVNVGTYGGLLGSSRNYRDGLLRKIGFSASVNYLWYLPVANEAFSLYGGLGGQIVSRRYYPSNLEAVNGFVRNVGLGPTAVAGLEYFSRQLPVSYFAETGLYAEILPAFLFFAPQFNLGVRYNF